MTHCLMLIGVLSVTKKFCGRRLFCHKINAAICLFPYWLNSKAIATISQLIFISGFGLRSWILAVKISIRMPQYPWIDASFNIRRNSYLLIYFLDDVECNLENFRFSKLVLVMAMHFNLGPRAWSAHFNGNTNINYY